MSELELNPEQLKAVRHGEGPLLIVAGAGTGKTRVITERILDLIESGRAKPGEILALTFTEKAAQEMEDRVDERLRLGHEEIWISTFHSFCDRVLREDGLEIGLDPRYRILTEPECWLFIRRHLFEFELRLYRPLGRPAQFIHELVRLFSRAKDDDVTPEEYLKYAERLGGSADLLSPAITEEAERQRELARAYAKYQELMLGENFLDFGDLQAWCLKLFRSRPSVLARYQDRFRYVLVDEFQDTNYAQNELLKFLAGKHRNIAVCGDDDQSIYKFRGASISNIMEFRGDFAEAATVVLTRNYRSTQVILDSAYRLIQNNNPNRLEVVEKIDKRLLAMRKEGPEVVFRRLLTPEAEAGWTASEIERLVKEEGRAFRDFAVLARNNDHLTPFVLSFRQHNLPFQLVGNRGLYDQEEVRDLIAYLRFLANFPTDSVSLFAVMNIPALGIPSGDVLRLFNAVKWQNRLPFDALEDVKGQVSKEGAEGMAKLGEMVRKHLDLARRRTASFVLVRFLMDSGYAKPLQEPQAPEDDLKARNIGLFFDRVKQFESASQDRGVKAFAEYLDMMMDAGENPAQAEIEDVDLVTLSTVHSAKGLEFPVVFLAALARQKFPSGSRGDAIPLPDGLVKERVPEGDVHLQEERRLFYVGMTRAKDRLYLSQALKYTARKEWKVSPFVEEALGPVGDEVEAGGGPLEEALPFDRERWARKYTEVESRLGKFSYSQLADYEWCPRLYKLKNVMQIPQIPSHSLSFGQTLHATLHEFHSRIKQGEDLSAEDLLAIYEARWNGSGFLTPEHEAERKEEGRAVLREYYRRHQEAPGNPEKLEETFAVKLGPYTLKGRIDRIDRLPQGGYEVIDYKSGKAKDPREVDKDEQMSVYALAAKEVFGTLPEALSLYYLESGEKISTQRGEEDIQAIKEKMLATIERIRKREFPPVLEERKCRTCDYRLLCRGELTATEG